MATLNISLPESLKGYAKEQAKTASYSNPSDYIRTLIREDKQKNEAKQRIEAMLLDGIKSGESIAVSNDYWNDLKTELHSELTADK